MNARALRIPALVTAVLAMLAACGGSDEAAAPTLRDTAYGQVDGLRNKAKDTLAWLGVPYAKPPVGELRWKAPVEPAAWTSTLSAKAFGRSCSSNGGLYGPGHNDTWDETLGSTIGNFTPVGSEDCLSLNIWRPDSNEGKLPVILFVHGGSNVTGYSADPMFQGANLAKAANAVVVNMNYRLGVFGFFNMAQLKTGQNANDDSGNFAILDLIQVLKFVKANIANFGGDPDNVTLTGQSAGAGNVWALIVSPQTDGLFHKAVPLSGGLASTRTPSFAQANNLLHHLLIQAGRATDIASAQAYAATQTPEQIAAFMRSVSGPTIISTVAQKGLGGSGVLTDGAVVPVDPYAAVAAGHYRAVPIMAGNTRDEGTLFAALNLTQAQMFPILYHYDADANPPPAYTLADILRPANLPVDAPVTGWKAVTARNSLPNDNAVAAVKAKQDNVWQYRFDWDEEPAPWNDVYGAAHVFDVAFILGNFEPSVFTNIMVSKANEAGRRALSESMMATLGAFARTGDPNNASLGVTWPTAPSYLIFDATPTAKAISVQ